MSHPRTATSAAAKGFGAAQRAELARLARAACPDDRARLAFCAANPGVGMRHIGAAIARRPIEADRHLALCAALGVDPVRLVSLEALSRRPGPVRGPIAWWHLGLGLILTREMRGLSVRAAAARAHLSFATFSRAERGQPVSFDSLAALVGFLRFHPHDVTAPVSARPLNVVKANCFTGDIR